MAGWPWITPGLTPTDVSGAAMHWYKPVILGLLSIILLAGRKVSHWISSALGLLCQ